MPHWSIGIYLNWFLSDTSHIPEMVTIGYDCLTNGSQSFTCFMYTRAVCIAKVDFTAVI